MKYYESFNNGHELLRNNSLDQELITITNEIGVLNQSARNENKRIQSIFNSYGWEIEKQIPGSGYRIDFYKDRVAIEIALSLFEEIFKDLIKLKYSAEIERSIDVGVIFVPERSLRNNPANTNFNLVCKTIGFFKEVLEIPIVCMALKGFTTGEIPEAKTKKEAILEAIGKNPGITQGKIKGMYGIPTTSVFIQLEMEGKITRIESGRSFKLFIKNS